MIYFQGTDSYATKQGSQEFNVLRNVGCGELMVQIKNPLSPD